MKNIFKFFGIAVLACGMMVACGEDPVEPNDTTPTNPQPQPQTPSVTCTFGSENFNFPVMKAQYVSSYSMTAFDFFTTGGSITDGMPGCEIYTTLVAPGQGSATLDPSSAQLSGEPSVCEFYDATYLTDGNGYAYGDWWADEATINMTAFDLDNAKASFTVTAVMFDALNALVQNNNPNYVGYADAERRNMTVNASNIVLTVQ